MVMTRGFKGCALKPLSGPLNIGSSPIAANHNQKAMRKAYVRDGTAKADQGATPLSLARLPVTAMWDN